MRAGNHHVFRGEKWRDAKVCSGVSCNDQFVFTHAYYMGPSRVQVNKLSRASVWPGVAKKVAGNRPPLRPKSSACSCSAQGRVRVGGRGGTGGGRGNSKRETSCQYCYLLRPRGAKSSDSSYRRRYVGLKYTQFLLTTDFSGAEGIR